MNCKGFVSFEQGMKSTCLCHSPKFYEIGPMTGGGTTSNTKLRAAETHAKQMEDDYVKAACEIADYEQKVTAIRKFVYEVQGEGAYAVCAKILAQIDLIMKEGVK